MFTHITVTAPEGRMTPISANDGVDPNAAMLLVEPGTVCRVRYSGDIRRAITRGDLVPCNLDGKPVALEQAGCVKPLDEVISGHNGGDKCDLAKLKAHREQLAAKAEEAKKHETKPSSSTTSTK